MQDDWPRWIRRFERFRQGSGLQSKSEESQVNALIYIMKDKVDDVLHSFSLSTEEKKVYKTVKEKFDNYFKPQQNVILERARFNQRKQQTGETVNDFITDLHCLADRCSYGDLRNEMIRNRIVVGLLDDALSEKLQLDSKLTLEIAVITTPQSEEVHKQQPVVRGKPSDHNTELVDAVHSRKGVNRQKCEHKSRNKAGTGKPVRTPAEQLHNKAQCCPRCGKTPTHGRQQCPAREAICHCCQKKGHF